MCSSDLTPFLLPVGAIFLDENIMHTYMSTYKIEFGCPYICLPIRLFSIYVLNTKSDRAEEGTTRKEHGER